MTYQSIVREVNLATGNTDRAQFVHDRVVQFNDTFKDALEYEQIKVTNDETNTTNYDSWIYSNNSYKELVRMKTIIFAPGTPSDIVFSGQYIRPQRQGGMWLLESTDDQYDQKLKAKLGECTEVFKWYDEDGVLREYPVVVLASYRKTLNEDKYMVLTKGQYIIGIPQDENTFKLQEGAQFILNNKHKYRIGGLEDIDSSTFMTVHLEKYEENSEGDNFELGIANYSTRPIFTISTDISSPQISIGDDIQITHTLLDKDGQISDKPVVYASSDENICTVDSSGLVTATSNGNCTIRVSMENNANVFIDNSIEVTATPAMNVIYTLSPDISIIYRQRDIEISVQALNNGQSVSETYTFSIDGSSDADSDRYEFEIVDSDTFRIKNLGVVGTVAINIVPDGNVGIAFLKTYELKNSWS